MGTTIGIFLLAISIILLNLPVMSLIKRTNYLTVRADRLEFQISSLKDDIKKIRKEIEEEIKNDR